MICGKCSDELEKAFERRKTLKEYEKFYFKPSSSESWTSSDLENYDAYKKDKWDSRFTGIGFCSLFHVPTRNYEQHERAQRTKII